MWLSALEEVRAAAAFVRERCRQRPTVGLVLGSGLSGLADALVDPVTIPYSQIPHCPSTTVPGHPGELRIGTLAGSRAAVLVGRLHCYEGYSPEQVAFPVRLLGQLGCQTLVVTNAAGGLNPLFWPGDLMAITDHINFLGLAGHSPLAGPEAEAFGPRFLDLKDAYDPGLIELAISASQRLGIELRRGVYAMVPGPSYETPAEVRLLQALGADAVGMSTVPEVLAARQLGMRVLAISCITNLASAGEKVSHEEVLAAGLAAGPLLANLIREVVARL